MDWQSIETAPKDGRTRLCGWPNGDFDLLVWKTNNRYDPPRSYWGDPYEMDDYELAENQPTLWLPFNPPSV